MRKAWTGADGPQNEITSDLSLFEGLAAEYATVEKKNRDSCCWGQERLSLALGHDERLRLGRPIERMSMCIPCRNKSHQPWRGLIQVGEVADTQPLALHNAEPLFDLVHGRSIDFEHILCYALSVYLQTQKTLGVDLPVFVMISLLGVKDYKMVYVGNRPQGQQDYPIDRPDLVIPEVMIDRFDGDPAEVMKPIFDTGMEYRRLAWINELWRYRKMEIAKAGIIRLDETWWEICKMAIITQLVEKVNWWVFLKCKLRIGDWNVAKDSV
jgi:hypothetical protein